MILPPIPDGVSPMARSAMEAHDRGLATTDALTEYRGLARAVETEGPYCVFCSKRGLNLGRFAQPLAGAGQGFAHVGCLSDHLRAEEQERRAMDGPW